MLQGGMGIGISLSGLASAVANSGELVLYQRSQQALLITMQTPIKKRNIAGL